MTDNVTFNCILIGRIIFIIIVTIRFQESMIETIYAGNVVSDKACIWEQY